MTDEEISEKHLLLRGSTELKYPPNESRCRKTYGAADYSKEKDKPLTHHRCFFAIHHAGKHEFSSECVTVTNL